RKPDCTMESEKLVGEEWDVCAIWSLACFCARGRQLSEERLVGTASSEASFHSSSTPSRIDGDILDNDSAPSSGRASSSVRSRDTRTIRALLHHLYLSSLQQTVTHCECILAAFRDRELDVGETAKMLGELITRYGYSRHRTTPMEVGLQFFSGAAVVYL
ncbi:hypothetical protein PENTCL1PPCAC_18550, partial [Pristionchus entomophagus]